jgi:hypothetical protein
MAEFVLHCMAQSGHSYKVALMLELCGADWEASWVDFFNGQTRSEEFRSSLNEMGEVPTSAPRGAAARRTEACTKCHLSASPHACSKRCATATVSTPKGR